MSTSYTCPRAAVKWIFKTSRFSSVGTKARGVSITNSCNILLNYCLRHGIRPMCYGVLYGKGERCMAVPESEKAAALRWFGEQPGPVQAEALKFQTDLLRQARAGGAKLTPNLVRDLLAEACRKMRHEEESLRMKARLDQGEAKKVHERRVARFKASRQKGKPSPKREAIRLKFYQEVQGLRRKEGFGWRNCAAYLKQYHRFDVTHMYLRSVIEDLERLEGNNGGD